MRLKIILLLFSYKIIFAQTDSTKTLVPTGKNTVGTSVYEWIDTQRDNRKIAVQIWYPSKATSQNLNKYSISKDYAHVSNRSVSNADFVKQRAKSPLVLICPGRGVEKFAYTCLAEELASHGYVVASLDMPEIGYVIYENGEIIKPNSAFRASRELMMGDYAKVDDFFEKPANIGMADLEFTLSMFKTLKIANKINFQNIGIFGHSLGGRIAGAFAANNSAVKAYISMEGVPPRKVRYEGMNVPMVLLYSSGQPEVAMVNYRSVIEGRKSDVYLFELQGFGHNSLTDFPMITPSQFKYKIQPQQALVIGRATLLNYFNKYLRGKNANFGMGSTKVETFLKN